MKLKLTIISILLTGCLWADWKTDVAKYFQRVNDYEGAVSYLSGIYKEKPLGDRKLISALIAFSFHGLENSSSERLWIDEYFGQGDPETVGRFDFLNKTTELTIINYINNWKARYPLIKEIKLHTPPEAKYNKRPQLMFISIHALKATNYLLLENEREISAGLLKKGVNQVKVLDEDIAGHVGENLFILRLQVGDVMVEKKLVLDVSVHSPEGIVIKNGGLAFKDKAFREEYKIVKHEKSKKHFDKKYFLLKSVLPAASGVVLFAGNQLFFAKNLDDNDYSKTSGPAYQGLKVSLDVVSIALVAKGIYQFFRSYKTKKKIIEKREYDQSAAAYNKLLREALKSAEDKVIFKMKLRVEKK